MVNKIYYLILFFNIRMLWRQIRQMEKQDVAGLYVAFIAS
ncbi:Uncharacterized protein dnl_49690 [Desulfonema limicola]|uniref:Uncharacterized protein n=1 Tax=Desulfonema limicola TaxID=45656 RepID=A0A975BC12_9BACT|nr:Uncharacterized protein dnl_49690 [Desulfonema limicola]